MQITVTPNAVAEVQKFMQEQGATAEAGLRVAVLPGGCSGFQYGAYGDLAVTCVEVGPDTVWITTEVEGNAVSFTLAGQCTP